MTELSKIGLDSAGEEVPFDAAEVGATMREMRIAMGRDLKDVSQELRIRWHYLEAIEDGRLDDLPGPAYTTGFLRVYADYLKLDADDIVGRFKKAGISIDRRTHLILPSPLEEGRLPTGTVLLFAAFVAIVSYAGWYYVSTTGHALPEETATLPQEFEHAAMKGDALSPSGDVTGALPPGGIADLTGVLSEPWASPAAPDPAGALGTVDTSVRPLARAEPMASPAAAVTGGAGGMERGPSESEMAEAAEVRPEPPPRSPRPPRPAAAPAPGGDEAPLRSSPPRSPPIVADRVPAQVPEPPPAPAIEPAVQEAAAVDPMAGARIVIRATEDSWVEISAGGKTLYSRLMREGDRHEMASRPGLTLVTGNAGGLGLAVDGTPIPPLGTTGQILQDVAIDASSLLKRVAASP